MNVIYRTEPCACGGVLTQETRDQSILVIVQEHNGSLLHARWRWDREPSPPTSATAIRDLSGRPSATSAGRAN